MCSILGSIGFVFTLESFKLNLLVCMVQMSQIRRSRTVQTVQKAVENHFSLAHAFHSRFCVFVVDERIFFVLMYLPSKVIVNSLPQAPASYILNCKKTRLHLTFILFHQKPNKFYKLNLLKITKFQLISPFSFFIFPFNGTHDLVVQRQSSSIFHFSFHFKKGWSYLIFRLSWAI